MRENVIFLLPAIATLLITSSSMILLHCPVYIKTQGSVEEKPMAFATLVTPAFAMGAVTLGHTLRKHHGNKYDMVCLVTIDVNATWRRILKQWWTVKLVEEYIPRPGFRRSWTKLRLWNMDKYSKIVYLDTDTLVIQPIDALFAYPELSCAVDPNPPQICNTGVMVLEPRPGTFKRMDKLARVDKLTLGVGDQSLINSYFRSFTPIPPVYNVPRTRTDGFADMWRENRTKVVHFVCKKPWKCGREGVSYCGCAYPELNQVWWDLWDEACAEHECMEWWR